MVSLKIISQNCNGLGDALKRRAVFHSFHLKKVDILMLQETHATEITEKIWQTEWGGKALFSNGSSNSKGVAILFKPNLNYTLHEVKKDTEGRLLCIDIEINDHRFTVCNLYAPNEDNPDFFKECAEYIEQFDNATKVIAGDFNLVMDISMDKKGGRPVTNFNSQSLLHTYMEEADLVDIWRLQHPSDRIFTWKRLEPSPIFCRLDMFLVSYDIVGKTEKSSIIPGFRSDHSAVSIDLNLSSQPRGNGFWKLNTSLLADHDYIQTINNCIEEGKSKYDSQTPTLKLELIKFAVQGESINFSKNKSKSKKNIMQVLDKKIKRLETCLAAESDSYKIDKIHKDLNSANLELQKLVDEKTKSAMFRCRTKWYEYGEKSSKYFFNLERSNFNKKVMNSTYLPDGTLTKNPDKILKEQRNYYEKLYTSDENVEFKIENKNDPKISDLDKDLVDKDITIDDLKYALHSQTRTARLTHGHRI